MKDLTPIAVDDFVLKERIELERLGMKARPAERVSMLSEEKIAERKERYERCIPLANDILEDARSALAVRFRFLDRALWRMPLTPSFDVYGLASDGVKLYYDPEFVVARFKLSSNEVVRDVVHCLFHCIFRHPFMLYSVLRQPWDVACDIAIEALLLDLVGEAFPGNMDRRERDALKVLGAQVGGVLTAERLYHFFSNEGKGIDLKSLAPIFHHDSHGLWYSDAEGESKRGAAGAARQETEDCEGGQLPAIEGEESLDDTLGMAEMPASDGGEGEESTESQSEEDARTNEDKAEGEGAPSEPDPCEKEVSDEWEDVSRRIQIELESEIARQGSDAGNMVAALAAINRERYDYTEFLKRFATLHERMRVNPDEFDYVYYKLGLDLYGNMPLVEPLEYKEDRSVRDFVIAIDTSESVSGDLVQAFMRKTYNILKHVESFHDRVNVHIIQCDARVQEDTKITSLDQLEAYLETMELKGFGGTDFRPVFNYVNLLIDKREFTDLRGLVYFTDGEGVFPQRQPAFDAVFVFLDDGYSDPTVPPWALKILLDERELG